MSTPQTTNGHATEPARCAHCGEALRGGGRFCSACGHPIADPTTDDVAAGATAVPEAFDPRAATFPVVTPVERPAGAAATVSPPGVDAQSGAAAPTVVHRPPAAPPPAPPAAGAARPPRRGLIVGLVAGAAVIAAALVAVLLLGGSDKTDAGTAYKQKVAAAVGPLLGANGQASDALAALHGTDPSSARAADARVAVRRARQAVTLAAGAIGTLNVPAGADQVARDTRQVLDRESAYYADVARVLNRPASTSTSGLAELASNLTSALSVAGPTVAGTQPTVSGVDRLIAWARTIRVRADRAKARRRNAARRTTASGGRTQSSAPVQTITTPPVTAARGTDCGGGVFAGPNTSCAFAVNVRRAWLEAPGATNTVRVFSPVTNQTYTMSCGPSGSGITCAGGNNASVTFDG